MSILQLPRIKNASRGADFTQTRHSTSYPHISPLSLDVSGKNVLVTGAAFEEGVGFATAVAFARAGAGGLWLLLISFDLIAKFKKAAIDARRAEPTVLVCNVDISSAESVRTLHDSVQEAFGSSRLDVLVNNAAVIEPDIEVNVRGLINMARCFLPGMLEGWKIEDSADGKKKRALSARSAGSSYRSSKLAVLRWTESLRLEYVDQGLLAYCVNSGAIWTKITEGQLGEVRDRLPDRPEVAGDTIAWLAARRREWLGGRYVSCVRDMQELELKKAEIVEGNLLKVRMAV
ncbi:NAD(P)-binding protein [Lophiostoma macrostomum CBS 122681]|uniref:NAD(P)-binding protein n=1 Tax=Lophiostoma macrostomum CBS 122681 TaxID=1314788 RepID=A0A6A6TJZ2_9PLEO|nr:NAD(P)-binding protein [Lophiostoma macrostomum CBS 122681]